MASNIGHIKRLVRERGFGFIATASGEEYFFHVSGVQDTTYDALAEGQRVSFEVEPSGKGPRAHQVRPA